MNQILRCDWLSERARWSHLARSGLPALSRKEKFLKSHIINPSLIKLVRSRWLDIGLVLFLREEDLGQYPAILTSHLVNNPYLLIIKITISSIVIGLKNSYFPLIHLPTSCYRTVCYWTVCYWTVCYWTVCYRTVQ